MKFNIADISKKYFKEFDLFLNIIFIVGIVLAWIFISPTFAIIQTLVGGIMFTADYLIYGDSIRRLDTKFYYTLGFYIALLLMYFDVF